MPKTALPTRFQFALVTTAARALNPLLAKDAQVDYGKIFNGVTRANFKARKATIVSDTKKALKGKTIAKDATLEHLAAMLDQFEHTPKSMDESVSEPQHKAMEAAAHGTSNLGIPKSVGQEFSRADTGKSFDMIRDWAMKKGMGDDDIKELEKLHGDSMPENALDEEVEDEAAEDEEMDEEEGAEDEAEEDDEAEDEEMEGVKPAKDKRMGKDRMGKDQRMARDTRTTTQRTKPAPKGFVTEDAMNKAITVAVANANKAANATAEARAFVRPFVGELPLAHDSAEKVLRAAADAMGIEDAADVHPSALKTLIKSAARVASLETGDGGMAHDSSESTSAADALDYFPEASRIRAAH